MRLSEPALIAALLVLAAARATAAPLPAEDCKTLKSEHQSLIAAGTKDDMAKGPEWARQNLTGDRLDKIARLIAVEEKLSFRCGQIVTARPNMTEPPEEADKAAQGGKRASRIPLPIQKKVATAGRPAISKPPTKK